MNSLTLANNNAINDSNFKKLLENCFSALTTSQEPHNMANLFNSKPDLVKELYAALLSAVAEFVRNSESVESVTEFLNQCNYSNNKIKLFADLYEHKKNDIEAHLINIGTHLPHITDVSWKIDYIIKSSDMDSSQGPLFRIGLQTEKYDPETQNKKIKFVNFSCDTAELQDLVYKLKDAVKHCQRIGSEH